MKRVIGILLWIAALPLCWTAGVLLGTALVYMQVARLCGKEVKSGGIIPKLTIV